jgi:hypothetical protein
LCERALTGDLSEAYDHGLVKRAHGAEPAIPAVLARRLHPSPVGEGERAGRPSIGSLPSLSAEGPGNRGISVGCYRRRHDFLRLDFEW